MGKYFTEQFLKLLVLLGELVYYEPICPIPDVWLEARFGGMVLKFKLGDEIEMSYTVRDDHQDEPFSIAPVTGANDAEGNPIPADGFTQTDAVSDNISAVSIVDDGAGGKALHFEGPGTAHVGSDTLYQGLVVKHTEATFTVTTGAVDPASIVGGDLTVPGLTPDPPAAPAAAPAV